MSPGRRSAVKRISPGELDRALVSSEAAPVYLLLGPEVVMRDRALAALREKVVEGEFGAFNYRSIEVAGLDATALSAEMRVLPMGGGRRLIVLGPADRLLKDQLKALASYADDPSPATCFVVVANEAKEALIKALAGAVVVDCSTPYEDRIPGELESTARSMNVRLERGAAAILGALCGRDLSRAVAELRKAADRVGPAGTVTEALVRDLAGGGQAGDIYKVASALARGDTAGAVRSVRRYLETQERAEPRVLYEMGLHLRRLLVARAHLAEGRSPKEAARGAGVFWKDADAFAEALPRWSEERIIRAFRDLLEADRRVKLGWVEGGAAVEGYLWAAMGPTAASRAGRAGRGGS
jgi:DNA polymerase-3 subunit delta